MSAKNGLAAGRKKAVIRHSKSKDYLIAIKNHGVEPELQVGATNLDFTMAFNWYGHVCTNSDARSFLNEYLKTSGREAEFKKLQRVPENRMPLTAAWIARMLVKYPHLLPASFKQTFENGLAKAFANVPDESANDDESKSRPSVRDRMKERASEIAGEIEGLLDDEAYDTNVYEWLQTQNVSSTYIPALIRKYQPLLEETVSALRGGSKDVKEAYSHTPKKETHALAEFLISMIKDMKRYAEANRTVRKARKPRVVSVEKKLQYFRPLKESLVHKVASINPAEVIGAQELWLFDTKYKKLTVLRATDRGGLDVKRTKVTGWDQAKSVTVSTGRKTHDTLARVLSSGKLALRKLTEDLKPVGYTQERVNERIVLLRAL